MHGQAHSAAIAGNGLLTTTRRQSSPPSAATPVTHAARGAQPPPVDEAEQCVREREPGDVRRDLGASGLVLQRRRRVRHDANVRARGVHRDEQAALAARHDAKLDLGRARPGSTSAVHGQCDETLRKRDETLQPNLSTYIYLM